MVDRFNFPVRAEPQSSFAYRKNESKLGDGYSVAVADGINTKTESWSVSVTSDAFNCDGTQGAAALAFKFIDEHESRAESFEWVTPFGDLIRVEAKGVSRKKSGTTQTVTAAFNQVFR